VVSMSPSRRAIRMDYLRRAEAEGWRRGHLSLELRLLHGSVRELLRATPYDALMMRRARHLLATAPQ
jgi:hypothetical protein